MLGLNFYEGTIEDCCELIVKGIRENRKFKCTPVNVDVFLNMQNYPALKEYILDSEILVADGIPLTWLSYLKRKPIKRITGADLMPMLCQKAYENHLKVFILGGMENVNKLAIEEITRQYGNVVGGGYSPPIGFEKNPSELEKMKKIINQSGAHIIFACLGSPKQEYWLKENFHSIGCNFALSAGASVDFMAKTVKRAPLFMQKIGMEWLYRLIKEPKRMFSRYIIKDTKFILVMIAEVFRKNE